MFFKIIVCFFLAYFLGTVQTAIILSNQVAKQDIRNFGSGNAGSTNMIRTFGWGLGALTFLGDLLKGALAFIIGNWIGGPVCAAIGGVMVVVGHNWPVQHSFRGGKGHCGHLWRDAGLQPHRHADCVRGLSDRGPGDPLRLPGLPARHYGLFLHQPGSPAPGHTSSCPPSCS